MGVLHGEVASVFVELGGGFLEGVSGGDFLGCDVHWGEFFLEFFRW